MNLLGSITASPDPPGVDPTRWIKLIAEHPNLQSYAPKMGVNPFTRGPYLYRPDPRGARLAIRGKEVGAMTWAEDGTNKIWVWGERDPVEHIAKEIAAELGGVYTRWEP